MPLSESDILKCINENTVMLARVDERLKYGDEEFEKVDVRLKVCEKTVFTTKHSQRLF